MAYRPLPLTPALSPTLIRRVRRRVWRFYRANMRDLPFRRTRDPYRIVVSEYMLQQTQIARVIPKYQDWIRRWPTWRGLAGASLADALTQWSGLGYNRRAKYLHACAKMITTRCRGRLPNDPAFLRTLPGMGPYTASAVLVFAFDAPLVAIDVNIRRAILHLCDLPVSTTPQLVQEIALALLPRGSARNWSYALMDYGALALSKPIKTKFAGKRQTPFVGSNRQLRGAILRETARIQSQTISSLATSCKRSKLETTRAVKDLAREGLLELTGMRVRLPA